MKVTQIMTIHRATVGEKVSPVCGSMIHPWTPQSAAELASRAAINLAVGKSLVCMTTCEGCAPAVDVTWYKPFSFYNMLPTVDL